MHKKHMFLRVFQKIALFVCVFCAVPAWSETTCDIDFTPITGNSWQNGTPTPTNPVAIESIGTKVGNKYAVQVAVNYDGGVVDMGTLNWEYQSDGVFIAYISDRKNSSVVGFFIMEYPNYGPVDASPRYKANFPDMTFAYYYNENNLANAIYIKDTSYPTVAELKQAMSGVMLYYQRATDETWVAPTLKTVYLDEPLRKVGDYADVLDYKNGTITRNVGVHVCNGNETVSIWSARDHKFWFDITGKKTGFDLMCNYYDKSQFTSGGSALTSGEICGSGNSKSVIFCDNRFETVNDVKTYLAQQYANGTPVTIYYPLATPVVEQIENWSCIPPITDIQIATTKMVDDEFAQAEANLATTVQTIESVVSRTITQTGQIATLQAEKQTRPDETCPANMKCLLVQDEDGTPHWYPIIEP